MVWLAGGAEITGGWGTGGFAPGEGGADALLPSVLGATQSEMPPSAAPAAAGGSGGGAPAGTVRLAGCEVIAGAGAEAAQAERISEKRGARNLTVDDIVADSWRRGIPARAAPFDCQRDARLADRPLDDRFSQQSRAVAMSTCRC